MLTQNEAKYLIELPKFVFENDSLIVKKILNYNIPINDRIYLIAENNIEYIFLLDITQSSKNYLKLTLHFQYDDLNIGLIRIDFNGRHKNPEIIKDNLPEIFKEYSGKWVEESHIHYYIEGYKPLAWAVPLTVDETFTIKTFFDDSNFIEIMQSFKNLINLKTELNINLQTTLL